MYSTSPTETEKPEHLSQAHEVYVWQHFTIDARKSQDVEITLPIHLRYHRPSDDQEYVQVALGAPKLLLQCSGRNKTNIIWYVGHTCESNAVLSLMKGF